MVKRLWAIGVLVLASLCLGAGNGASASAPTCGQTITKDTVLRRDLIDCSGPGLVIGADGITIDLGGHTISGKVVFDPDLDEDVVPREAGVDNTRGFDRVTVENGTIQNFRYGVRFVGAEQFVARDLTGHASTSFFLCFVCVEGSKRGTVRNIAGDWFYTDVVNGSDENLLENAGGSIGVVASHRNTIHGYGSEVALLHANENTIENGTFTGAFKSIVIQDSRGNVIRNNEINAAEGIWLERATETLVERNTITGAGDLTYAVIVRDSDRNSIRTNVLEGPQPPPGQASFKGGIALCRASANTVEGNTIRYGFVGINLGVDSSCEETGLSGNVIRGNTVSGSKGDGLFPESTGDGILIGPLATATLVEENTLLANSDDGIDIENRSTVVTKNTAIGNGDLGIEATGGAVDGGGNIARDNGNPAQCLGPVRCTKR